MPRFCRVRTGSERALLFLKKYAAWLYESGELAARREISNKGDAVILVSKARKMVLLKHGGR